MDFLTLDPLLKAALREDLGQGDLTTRAIVAEGGRARTDSNTGQAPGPGERQDFTARIYAREEMILAGWPVFARVFQLLGQVVDEVYFSEGSRIPPVAMGMVRGEAETLLGAERVALNFLQRMCGVATLTRRYVDRVRHTRVRILDTRKTTPLWRMLEKYAVRMGGGHNHRFGLGDGFLIKENHVTLAGGIENAVRACRSRSNHLQKIEVEVRTLEELRQALEGGADAVLLDNMKVDQVREAVALARDRCLIEVSGGVNEENVVPYAETGVDFVSLGLLTHSFSSADISLLLEPL